MSVPIKLGERMAADRRLWILILLERTPSCSANENLIHAALPDYGHYVSQDTVRADFAWLEEQRLVAIEEIGGLMVARATARGLDVATGRAIVPGVKRPAPGE